MASPGPRWPMLFGGSVIVFGVTVAIGMAMVPEPRTDTDYLVIGSVATFVGLATVFVALLATVYRSGDNFVKRAKPGSDEPGPGKQDG